MTRIDIFSGFLGAGKTTLIRKLINEGYKGQKLVLIENEFGEIAIDGGFLKDAGVQITEMNSGCICCTLVGDFTKALKKVMDDYAPDRIIIEPSGVGKLSDVAKAVEHVEGAHIGAKVTVVDAGKCRMSMRTFGEFFNDQVENADLIVMSRTDITPEHSASSRRLISVKLRSSLCRALCGSSESAISSARTPQRPTLSILSRWRSTLGWHSTYAVHPSTMMSPTHSRFTPMPSTAPI